MLRLPHLLRRAAGSAAASSQRAWAGSSSWARQCSTETANAPSVPKRARGKNFFEVSMLLPEYGVGAKLYRTVWLRNGWDPQQYHWRITRVHMRKGEATRSSGRAWGVLCWKGVERARSQLVRSTYKRQWRYLDAQRPPRLLSESEVEAQREVIRRRATEGAEITA